VRLTPPFVPQAVVFDLDGLLVDSEPTWERAERRLVTEDYGRPWDPALRPLLLGRGAADAAALLGEFLDADPREVARRMTSRAVEEFKQGVDVLPGAAQLIMALAGWVPLAVATNSQRVLAELALTSIPDGVAGQLDALVCAEDVARPKPAPDCYLEACHRLGVDPTTAVAFEDSPVGAAAAKAAGCWVVAVPSLGGVALDAADATVASLAEVDPGSLLLSPGAGGLRAAPSRTDR
jgi:HAD superfamily hydrolase (TIGR01509 family)